MWTGKCKCMCLGPFSLGLALGVLSGLATLLIGLWALKFGLPTNVATQMGMAIPTSMSAAWTESLWSLITGFIFGFFLAIFYNIFACCFGFFRRKNGEGCECGCGSGCKRCNRTDIGMNRSDTIGSRSSYGSSTRTEVDSKL